MELQRMNRLAAQRALLGMNDVTARYGLTLTRGDVARLEAARARALQAAGRLEFGGGVLPKLAYAFCDSPFICQADYAETLEALTEIFYHFKGEALEQLSDDALINAMKEAFDGPCQGSLEYLRGTALERLCGRLRGWSG